MTDRRRDQPERDHGDEPITLDEIRADAAREPILVRRHGVGTLRAGEGWQWWEPEVDGED